MEAAGASFRAAQSCCARKAPGLPSWQTRSALCASPCRARPRIPFFALAPAQMSAQPIPDAVSAEVDIERWTRGSIARTTDQVAEEVPVALVYHDVPHVVMLATPADLEDYGVGFTLSEGLVARADEIRGVEVTRGEASADVKITVAWERFTQLLQRRRNLAGRTGCGLCGAETAADAIRECAPVPAGVSITA